MMHQGVTSFYRRFDFFDSEKLAEDSASDEKSSFSRRVEQKSDKDDAGGLNLYEDFEPNCAAAGNGVLCFGDNSGQIQFVNRDLQILKFKSHSERITKLFKTKNNDYLVVVGKHDYIPKVIETVIKIWYVLFLAEHSPFFKPLFFHFFFFFFFFFFMFFNIDASSRALNDLNELGKPKEVKSFRAFSDGEEVPISALAVTENCSQIAVGCATGTVILFDVNLKSNRAPKERKLTKSDSRSVTGLHYLEDLHDPLLYVITVEDVSVYYLRRKNMPYVCETTYPNSM